MIKPAVPTNEDIADALGRIADLLEAQDADRYRVNAYRRAARVILSLDQPAAAMAVSAENHRAAPLQPRGKILAPHHAFRPRRLALYRPFLQHRPRP